MTSTPGPTPGTSDSPEPDDGASPTTAQSETPAEEAATAEAGTSADAAESETDADPAGPSKEAGSDTRWSQEQPPPASEEWARWAQPPGIPSQGGRQPGTRWGAPRAGVPKERGQRQAPPQHGWAQYGQGQQPGSSGGQPGWQPPHGARQTPPDRQAAWGWSQGRPQAPKPGVVPLRPLDMGEILEGAVATFRRHWRVIVGITLTIGVLTQALDVVVQHRFMDAKALDDLQNDRQASFRDVVHAAGSSSTSTGLMLLIALIGTTISSALLTIVVSRAVLGRGVRASDTWRETRAHLPRVVGLALLIPLIAGAVVIVATVPGLLVTAVSGSSAGPALVGLGIIASLVACVWVYFQLSLSAPALILEKQGVVGSMKRSWKLVRGSWWRVLGIQLVATLLTTVVGAVIEWPFLLIAQAVTGDGTMSLFPASTGNGWGDLSIFAVGGTLSGAVTLPVTAGVVVLLYLDQRIRRESLDIELARAASEN